MENRSLKFIAESCASLGHMGRLDREIAGISTDSRRVSRDCLFVALRGERFDGHAFVGEAIEQGAAAALVEAWPDSCARSDLTAIRVRDTRRALGAIGHAYRRGFDLPIFAVGGSNGKTTTKELIASVLGSRKHVLKSPASFNNDIGVPLTLLELNGRHEAAVVEVGTNHPGELAGLMDRIEPRYAVVTNIGREHLEFFESLEGVAAEQGSLAASVPSEGALFLYGDDPWAEYLSRLCRGRVIRVGFSAVNDWRINDWQVDATGVAFRLRGPDEGATREYRVDLVGGYQAINGAFAVAAGHEMGLEDTEIREGLRCCQAPTKRMQIRHVEGLVILDDCYNANADSMKRALEALAAYPSRGRRVAVLGDMAELGRHAYEAHREVGDWAGRLKIDRVAAVGVMARVTAEAAAEAGVREATAYATIAEARDALRDEVGEGDTLLLKASRAMRLEELGRGWWQGSGVPVASGSVTASSG